MERPVGAHHLAFLRTLVEGASTEKARQYLFHAERTDRVVLVVELARLEHKFARAAALAGKPHLLSAIPFAALRARLIAVDEEVGALAAAGQVEARFAEFVATVASDAFTDEELMAQFRAQLAHEQRVRCGSTRRLARPGGDENEGERAPDWDVRRARQAIDLLWDQVGCRPEAQHPIALWFQSAIAGSLEARGINRIVDLIAFMNAHGHRWYTRVAGVGAKRAQRIGRWLRTQCAAGQTLLPAALKPARLLSAAEIAATRAGTRALLPFEAMVLPFELDGRAGTNRERSVPCQLEADTDREAIERRLAAEVLNAGTRREYQRDAERVLLWCVFEKGRPLSSMTVEDCVEYREFLISLTDPKASWPWRLPRERWVAVRRARRTSPLWKPFAGCMSAGSIERALVIVRAMFDWLVTVHYLRANPWRAVGLALKSHSAYTRGRPAGAVVARGLGEAELAFLETFLASLGGDERAARFRFIAHFGMYSGLRRDELVRAVSGDLVPFEVEGQSTRYELAVRGKGDKNRAVALPRRAMAALEAYFAARGIDAATWQSDPTIPLLAALPNEGCAPTLEATTSARHRAIRISAQRLYAVAKRMFARAAALAASAGDAVAADRLSRASTHWLRHTYGTRGAAGMPPSTLMQEMGHADIRTTLKYV
ncbi:MAG TPA: phage integrase family protein, partial [Burkholderiaceae bacterium]|nr:phage integrase family protein [Burkholderiaceae bacterium]